MNPNLNAKKSELDDSSSHNLFQEDDEEGKSYEELSKEAEFKNDSGGQIDTGPKKR